MPYCAIKTGGSSTEGTVWVKWNTYSGATSAATTCNVWTYWNDGTATNGSTWGSWTSANTSSAWTCWVDEEGTVSNYRSYKPRVLTAEEQEQERLIRERAREAEKRLAEVWKKKQAEEVAAEKKARKLLWAAFNAEQRKEAEEKKHFHVISESGKRFRVDLDTAHGNVKELDDNGRVRKSWCAQPKGVPKFDQILAQKLALEHAEEAFTKVANAC